jgi:protein-disulfide isomerase
VIAEAEENGDVVIVLHAPRVEVGADPARVRGNANAPVMIVEFADFSCPYCKKAEASLKEVLAKYPGKVSLSFRDYPLRDIHPQAELAAEAARCAGEQGRFWEYHDLLYGGSDQHDRDNLVVNARVLQLDEKRFDTCLDSGKYKPEIDKDLQDGARAGVTGTPGFFIDGIFLDGAQPPAAFDKIIDEKLSKANPKHAAN